MMEQLKHSGLGIASCITSIFSGGMLFIVVVIAGVMETTTPGGMDDNSAGAIVLNLSIFLFIFVALVAMGLGVGALFQTKRNKLFAIFGIVLSMASILGVLGLILIGASG